MAKLLALDVAILPPADVSALAISVSAALPAEGSKGLRLDAAHLPHVTLTQQFVEAGELDAVVTAIAGVLESRQVLRLRAIGGGRSGDTVWISIEPSPPLIDLHRRLMDALHRFERRGGTARAFADTARDGDARWVSSYRAKASFRAFAPHITLGHAAATPRIEPFEFDAATVAACHLGRFCTCQRVLRSWTLSVPGSARPSPPGRYSPSA